jgi:large subunit ribosomal protein L25
MEIKVYNRKEKGSRSARRLRRDGKIPGIIYGKGEEPRMIFIEEKEVKNLSRGEHLSLILDKELDVVVKEIQVDPTSSKFIHIDFQHLHKGEKVRIRVPVILEGVEELIKKGLIVEQMLNEVEIECLPKNIPEEVRIDTSSWEVGKSFQVKDLELEKVKILTAEDITIATVGMVKKEEVVEEKEEVEEEEKKEEKEEEKRS